MGARTARHDPAMSYKIAYEAAGRFEFLPGTRLQRVHQLFRQQVAIRPSARLVGQPQALETPFQRGIQGALVVRRQWVRSGHFNTPPAPTYSWARLVGNSARDARVAATRSAFSASPGSETA